METLKISAANEAWICKVIDSCETDEQLKYVANWLDAIPQDQEIHKRIKDHLAKVKEKKVQEHLTPKFTTRSV